MYNNYSFLTADHLTFFGCGRSGADFAGAFFLRVAFSSTTSNATIGSRLIKFGD